MQKIKDIVLGMKNPFQFLIYFGTKKGITSYFLFYHSQHTDFDSMGLNLGNHRLSLFNLIVYCKTFPIF